MKIRNVIHVVAFFLCVSSVFASDPPTENQGANAMTEKIKNESNGLLTLVKFTKTNGQKSTVNGVEYYTMDLTVEVVANQACAMTGFQFGGDWNGSFGALKAEKRSGGLSVFNSTGAGYGTNKQVAKGTHLTFNTSLKFDLTERGWRTGNFLPADTAPPLQQPQPDLSDDTSDAAKAADLYNRGEHEEDLEQKIKYYSAAIHINPNFTDAYYSRGLVYSKKGEFDLAISDYSQAVRLEPKNYDAYNDLGKAYFSKGDYDKAISDYSTAIKIDSKSIYAYFSRGDAYMAKTDYDHAIEDFTQTIQINHNERTGYRKRAAAYLAKGDFDKAIADYDAIIQNYPDDKDAIRRRDSARKHIANPDVPPQNADDEAIQVK